MADKLTVTHSSGSLRTVDINGTAYNVSGGCQCAGVEILSTPRPFDPADSVSVEIRCAVHGTSSGSAIKCGLPFKCEVVDNRGVFAWAEARHERDKRVAWGMKQRRTA